MIQRIRAQNQGLAGARPGDVAAAVRRVVGVQAQDVRAARLAVRVRTSGLVASDVDGAVADRSVVRTWAMRGTLHMLAAQDVRWLVGLLGPRFAAGLRGRRQRLGLDDATVARGVAELRAVLAGGPPRTRTELMAASSLELTGQAIPHLLGFAAMNLVIVRGPEAAKDEPTYVLADEWLPQSPELTADEALARLAERYLAGHAPAGAADLAAWSGLPAGSARRAFDLIADRIQPVQDDLYSLVESTVEEKVPLRLLGHFDGYLLGYRDRRDILAAELDRRIRAGGGMIMPAVLVDGRIAGTWRQQRRRGRIEVTVQPFGRPLPVRALRAEVDDLGRFLGQEAELVLD